MQLIKNGVGLLDFLHRLALGYFSGQKAQVIEDAADGAHRWENLVCVIRQLDKIFVDRFSRYAPVEPGRAECRILLDV